MTRYDLARRLADLVDDDEAIRLTVAFLEAREGGQVTWHIDDAGVVQGVDRNGIYRKRKKKRTIAE